MPPRRCNLKRPFGNRLTANLGEVRPFFYTHLKRCLRPCQHLLAFDMVDEREQRMRREDINIPRKGCFRAVIRGANNPFVLGTRPKRRGQHPRYGLQLAIERQFTQRNKSLQRIGRNHAQCDEHRKRNRHIEMRAFFLYISRGKVHQNTLGGQLHAHGTQGRPHPLTRFGHRFIRQPHHRKGRQPRPQMHLHLDRQGLNPLKCNGVNTCDHKVTLPIHLQKPSRKMQVGLYFLSISLYICQQVMAN